MNQDIQKSFTIRLLVVSAAVTAVWYTIVGPQQRRVQDLAQTYTAQVKEIAQGEESISLHADQMMSSVEQMSTIRDDLLLQLDASQSSNMHKQLQDSAESHDLTVSRIEPLRTSLSKRVNTVDQSELKLETKEFRVECVGSFGGIVGYLEDLSEGSNIVKVSSFRVIPVSSDYARMIMQVSVYQLMEVPKAFKDRTSNSTTQVTKAGVSDDEA